MIDYLPGDPVLELHGALAVLDGVRPSRLPANLRERIPTTFMRAVVDAAAGVRLSVHTEATRVELRCSIHPIEFVGVRDYEYAVDLVVDGRVIETRTVEGGRAMVDPAADTIEELPSEPQVVAFDLVPGGKIVELWLPHNAIVDVHGLSTDLPAYPAEPAGPRWIHHGSSVSHCMEADSPTGTWPAVAARALDYDLVDLGFAGSAMLDPFVARAIRDQPADIITLKLGINLLNVDLMTMRGFVPAVHGFLDTIRDGHPTTPIVLVSPVFCPSVEDRPGPMDHDPATGLARSIAVDPVRPDSLTLRSIRSALAAIVASRGDSALHYLDGLALFGDPDVAAGRLPDGIHPDALGYRLIGERFAALLPAVLAVTAG